MAAAMESPVESVILLESAMSSISGLGGASPIQPTQNVNKPAAPAQADPAGKPSITDRLELSGVSHLFQALKTNDIRTDKVASIKSQLADGSYDADGSKLDGAVDKLLDEIQK
jgi:anti-sigma28 factor (negative regulator of flagellin synthesis)